MFETSGDILNLVIAASVLVFTFFVCWLMYYFVMIVKHAHDMVQSIREKINRVEKILNLIQEKVEHSASYLPLLAEGVTKIVKYFVEKKNAENTSNESAEKSSK